MRAIVLAGSCPPSSASTSSGIRTSSTKARARSAGRHGTSLPWHGRQRAQRILEAAVRRIAREGIDGVRIARIAMDAGVSAALVHYHFDSRDALLVEALEYSYELAGDTARRRRPTDAAAAQRLERR